MEDKAHGFVRWFADLTLEDRNIVGGKGASLGELVGAGVPVPPGFVVVTDAFERFLASADPDQGIRERIGGLDPADTAAIASTGAEIRARLKDAAIPADVRSAIGAAYADLSNTDAPVPVAVRSSATCEDSADASFAGLQDTYLWTLGEETVVDAVRDCWASLYNDESLSYRRRLGLPESGLSIAVVVQEMVDAECAGVMFTRSPTTGDRSVILIEGSWGLGSCLVSGEVTPDRFVVNKVTGEIDKRDISDKAMEHVPAGDGGVDERPVDDGRRKQSCLDDESIERLRMLGKQIEAHYGCPQDIEWAIPRDSAQEVRLLQSRPETVWANREKSPAAKPTARDYDHLVNLMSAGKTKK